MVLYPQQVLVDQGSPGAPLTRVAPRYRGYPPLRLVLRDQQVLGDRYRQGYQADLRALVAQRVQVVLLVLPVLVVLEDPEVLELPEDQLLLMLRILLEVLLDQETLLVLLVLPVLLVL